MSEPYRCGNFNSYTAPQPGDQGSRFGSRRYLCNGNVMTMKWKPSIPDLQSQYESLLDQVWRSEADWRFWDRMDTADRMHGLRARRNRSDQGGAETRRQAA